MEAMPRSRLGKLLSALLLILLAAPIGFQLIFQQQVLSRPSTEEIVRQLTQAVLTHDWSLAEAVTDGSSQCIENMRYTFDTLTPKFGGYKRSSWQPAFGDNAPPMIVRVEMHGEDDLVEETDWFLIVIYSRTVFGERFTCGLARF